MTEHWSKDLLNLKVGDQIIWQGEEISTEGGPAIVSPGMKGQVISLHEGAHLDVIEGGAIPPKALVQFASGMSLLVDKGMRWKKVSKG